EEIVRLTRRDWLDKLNPNERGMGDHGFNGMNRNGGCIETPPKEQNLLYKVFSHFRIRVEQIFEKIHDFRATKDQIRSPLKGNRDDVLLCHQKNGLLLQCLSLAFASKKKKKFCSFFPFFFNFFC